MELYLVTGFLGSGKTTLVKNWMRQIAPRRVHLIINEFGKVGVDGVLLKSLDAELAEICDGSVFCACRLEQFRQALSQAAERRPDVILVETSGLADPTGVESVLADFPQIPYRGSVCVADALHLPKALAAADACARQLAVSSLVLLNKTDLASPGECAEAERLIREANPTARIERTQFGRFDTAWLESVAPAGIAAGNSARDIALQKTCLAVSADMPPEKLRECLVFLTGGAYRIKGFVRLGEHAFFTDCVGSLVSLTPWTGAADNRLVLLAGHGMPLRKTVRSALGLYGEWIAEDRQT